MEVLTLQTRVYYPDGINITNKYITQMEVLTLQTRVYYPDGSINITNTSINITNTSILPRWKY